MLFGKFVIIKDVRLDENQERQINDGEMAEWTKAHDSKSCVAVRQPGVQIPLSPYNIN